MNKPIHGEPKPKDVPSDMQRTPPIPCEFKPGDRVIFTNDYGVQFHQRVRGFAKDVWDGRFVYLDTSCWWFPKRPSQLQDAAGVLGTVKEQS